MTTPLLQVIGLSLKVAVLATLLNLLPGIFWGWVLARKRFPAKTVVDATINIPLVLPPIVTGYLLLIALGPGSPVGRILAAAGMPIAFTWWGAVVAAAVVSFPLLVRAVRGAIEQVDPALEDAARVLRAPEWAIFWRVTVALAFPGIMAGTLLTFARALGEFGATIVLASNIPGKTQTIPLAIFSLINQPGGEKQAGVLVVISIVISYLSIFLNEWLLRRRFWRGGEG